VAPEEAHAEIAPWAVELSKSFGVQKEKNQRTWKRAGVQKHDPRTVSTQSIVDNQSVDRARSTYENAGGRSA
jgi:hypothetical protein